MALHTLKQLLHTLTKYAGYQVVSVLVCAVYAKSKNLFYNLWWFCKRNCSLLI
jgi:hypothetical protein